MTWAPFKAKNFDDETWSNLKQGQVQFDEFAEAHTIAFVDRRCGMMTFALSLPKPNVMLYNEAPHMFEAMKEFVARVEAGEVRSKRTYRQFKEIIARVEGDE